MTRAPQAPTHEQGGVIILGAGWVGSRLAAHLAESGVDVCVTNRPPSANQPPQANQPPGMRRPPGSSRPKPKYFRPIELPESIPRRAFDMSNRETWTDLPPPSSLRAAVITFAAMPEECAAFWDEYLSHVPRVICYSSTAVYKVETPGQLVDEDTPLRGTPRANAEEFMRERGATVLTISGIFGEPQGSRGVCSCLAAYATSGVKLSRRKTVNMVHVDDIIESTVRLLEVPQQGGRRINVGGHHFTMRDLLSHCNCDLPTVDDNDAGSKRVSSEYLLNEVLPSGYHFAEPLKQASVVHCSTSTCFRRC